MSVKNLTHGAITIKDGGAGSAQNSLAIPVDEGNLEFTVRREAQTVMNRGSLYGFTEGVEEPVTLSFTIKFEEWLSDTSGTPSPVDALRQTGEAAAWVSTLACGPYCVDLYFLISPPAGCGETNEQLIFADFHADEIRFAEGEEYNTLVVSGKALVLAPTASRDV